MEKVKLIVHEQFSGTRTSEEIFAAVFLSANSGGDGGELISKQKFDILN